MCMCMLLHPAHSPHVQLGWSNAIVDLVPDVLPKATGVSQSPAAASATPAALPRSGMRSCAYEADGVPCPSQVP